MSKLKTLTAVAALIVAAGCNPIGTAVNVVTAPIDAAATVTGAVL